MAISKDTAALVAAQLTVAWAYRVGASAANDPGAGGATIFQAYQLFLRELEADAETTAAASIDGWIASHKNG